MKFLTKTQLEELQNIDTPTVANAVEKHHSQENTDGFMGYNITCQFPDLGIMVGQAVTATFNTTTTGKERNRSVWHQCLRSIDSVPVPVVIVAKDVGPRPLHGCHFGDSMANVAKRVGAIGLVTDAGVRDVETVHGMGFHYFSPGMVPAHGNFGLDETGGPVEVGGVLVNEGDVVHADSNGVVAFHPDLADFVIEESKKVWKSESDDFDWVNTEEFTLDKYIERREA